MRLILILFLNLTVLQSGYSTCYHDYQSLLIKLKEEEIKSPYIKDKLLYRRAEAYIRFIAWERLTLGSHTPKKKLTLLDFNILNIINEKDKIKKYLGQQHNDHSLLVDFHTLAEAKRYLKESAESLFIDINRFEHNKKLKAEIDKCKSVLLNINKHFPVIRDGNYTFRLELDLLFQNYKEAVNQTYRINYILRYSRACYNYQKSSIKENKSLALFDHWDHYKNMKEFHEDLDPIKHKNARKLIIVCIKNLGTQAHNILHSPGRLTESRRKQLSAIIHESDSLLEELTKTRATAGVKPSPDTVPD